ncbi:integrase core domain-containing protein [Streptomyces sp. NBC_01422]
MRATRAGLDQALAVADGHVLGELNRLTQHAPHEADALINHLRDGFGVKPVGWELNLSVSACNARRRRPKSARRRRATTTSSRRSAPSTNTSKSSTASVGSVADSYDGAMGEALNGSFKAELIDHHGPWRDADQVERAVVQWIGRYNTERLHSALG